MRTNLSDLCEQRTLTSWTARQISSIQPPTLSACYAHQHISNSYLQTGKHTHIPTEITKVVVTNQSSLCIILLMLLIVAMQLLIRAADLSIIQYGELMFDEQSSCGQVLMNGGRAE